MNGDKYEGEFKKDFEDGKGVKEYYNHPSIISIRGQFCRGVPDGNVEIEMKNGDFYKGKMKKGKIEGEGKMTYSTNKQGYIYYEGSWLNGKFNGLGVIKM